MGDWCSKFACEELHFRMRVLDIVPKVSLACKPCLCLEANDYRTVEDRYQVSIHLLTQQFSHQAQSNVSKVWRVWRQKEGWIFLPRKQPRKDNRSTMWMKDKEMWNGWDCIQTYRDKIQKKWKGAACMPVGNAGNLLRQPDPPFWFKHEAKFKFWLKIYAATALAGVVNNASVIPFWKHEVVKVEIFGSHFSLLASGGKNPLWHKVREAGEKLIPLIDSL